MEKFRREAPKEDNLSLEPLYRYLLETPAHDILQKDSGKAVRLNQERWGYDDWKLIQNGKVVKRDFGFPYLPTFGRRRVRLQNMLGMALSIKRL